MGNLQDKVAVITGGTRGLGLAIAQAYAAEGAAVVVASRSAEAVDQAVRALAASGANARGQSADVGRLEEVEALAELALQAFGRIDIWVNNAGTAGPYGPTLEISPQAFNQVVQTNILGVYYGARVALKHFLPQRSGKLINLLGHGFRNPVPYQNAYASSKAWVRSFTLALADETQGSGVGVFAFNPGMVLTDLLTNVEVVEGSQRRLERFPAVVRLLARPAEIPAQKAVWLASAATDGKTGLLVSLTSPLGMFARLLSAPLHRSEAPVEIRIKTIPADQG
jgi:NAD(P)-dependent dehydrogenase (short-subunit alcohol dehydrogenase family)